MGEKKEGRKESGMCFDDASLTELRKLMNKEGVGSLCREMMGRMVGTGKGEPACLKLMRKMMTDHGKAEEGRGKS
jgi:hypothetical protein